MYNLNKNVTMIKQFKIMKRNRTLEKIFDNNTV